MLVRFMVFNATFNNISVMSWWSVLLVEETGENHWPVTDKLYHILFHISSILDFFIGVDMVMCHALIFVKEIQQSLTW